MIENSDGRDSDPNIGTKPLDLKIGDSELPLDKMRPYEGRARMRQVGELSYNPYDPNQRPTDFLKKENRYKMSPATAEPATTPTPTQGPTSQDGYINVEPIIKMLDDISKSGKN